MKKICHITTVHSLLDTRIFYKEAKTLLNAGYDVSLIVRHNKDEIVDGIKIIVLPKTKNRFSRILFLTREAYNLALGQKADIYHFHDPEFLPWAEELKKKTKAKVIYDIHEDILKQILLKHWLPVILRKPISIFFDVYQKIKIKNFDYVITVREDIEKELRKFNSKIITVKNFPVLDYFKDINIKPLSKSILTLIYNGTLTRNRGIKEIVKALEFLPDNVQLVLIGRFSSLDFKQQIMSLKGFKKVKYFGQIPFEEIPKYLSRADIGVSCTLPMSNYRSVGEPTKIFEYMAAALPVIASNFSTRKKIIEGNKCGICIDPTSPEEIAGAVRYLIGHPEEARKMGDNGRKAVLEKYNWENEGKKLLKVYEELLKD